MVRGTLSLPNGSGKTVRVIVFTENPDEAKERWCRRSWSRRFDREGEGGWTDFDVAIATTTSAMKSVRKVARVLGPRGLMPNPKSGTVTDDIPAAIKEVMGGRVEFKMDKTANVAIVVGKRSFEPEQSFLKMPKQRSRPSMRRVQRSSPVSSSRASPLVQQ